VTTSAARTRSPPADASFGTPPRYTVLADNPKVAGPGWSATCVSPPAALRVSAKGHRARRSGASLNRHRREHGSPLRRDRVEPPLVRTRAGVGAAVLEADAGTEAELLHGVRHERLTRTSQRSHACGQMDSETAQVRSDHFDLAGMDAGASVKPDLLGIDLRMAVAQRMARAGSSNASVKGSSRPRRSTRCARRPMSSVTWWCLNSQMAIRGREETGDD